MPPSPSPSCSPRRRGLARSSARSIDSASEHRSTAIWSAPPSPRSRRSAARDTRPSRSLSRTPTARPTAPATFRSASSARCRGSGHLGGPAMARSDRAASAHSPRPLRYERAPSRCAPRLVLAAALARSRRLHRTSRPPARRRTLPAARSPTRLASVARGGAARLAGVSPGLPPDLPPAWFRSWGGSQRRPTAQFRTSATLPCRIACSARSLVVTPRRVWRGSPTDRRAVRVAAIASAALTGLSAAARPLGGRLGGSSSSCQAAVPGLGRGGTHPPTCEPHRSLGSLYPSRVIA